MAIEKKAKDSPDNVAKKTKGKKIPGAMRIIEQTKADAAAALERHRQASMKEGKFE